MLYRSKYIILFYNICGTKDKENKILVFCEYVILLYNIFGIEEKNKILEFCTYYIT